MFNIQMGIVQLGKLPLEPSMVSGDGEQEFKHFFYHNDASLMPSQGANKSGNWLICAQKTG
jgi:hypothetical protein